MLKTRNEANRNNFVVFIVFLGQQFIDSLTANRQVLKPLGKEESRAEILFMESRSPPRGENLRAIAKESSSEGTGCQIKVWFEKPACQSC
jgi:hypothetical protein